jgi:protein gp37
MLATDLYHSRKLIAAKVLSAAGSTKEGYSKTKIAALARAMATPFKCYAGILHLRHGKDGNNPGKRTNKGYAPVFEQVTRFSGRMEAAASWGDLRGTQRTDKPWLNESPRLLFVSDMADLLSKAISFEYIRDEVIENVISTQGRRHVWLWLTKRPQRMVDFSLWLEAQGIRWPNNLVAMTSVTSQQTVGRVELLKKVRCRYRGLSVEPLWSAVKLPLSGINWAIVGGESGPGAQPFHLEWARDIHAQCLASEAAFFMKQLGSQPFQNGKPLQLKDGHGGEWSEWPEDLRIRQLPVALGA